jgi:transposase
MGKIQYVAVDVDDKAFHGYAIATGEKEGVPFCSKPTVGALIHKLEGIGKPDHEIKTCYEATYSGYVLQRDLAKRGYACDVIAPSLIPRAPGSRVKTDRIDAKQLAIFYQKGLLTPVHIPDEADEQARDLIRSRGFLMKQSKALKVHILSTCRRMGIGYRQETGRKQGNYWTGIHLDWLGKRVKQMKGPLIKMNLSLLLNELSSFTQRIGLYDTEIRRIAQEEKYRRKAKALVCYRGIDTLSAMTLINEIGDIDRFCHPERLTSYAGMDLIEYSSGGKERRYSMSKMGNRHIRTTVIESCQGVLQFPVVSKKLKQRRQGAEPQMIEIADRSMNRLHKKATHLWHEGKPKNKIKVACARELLSFVWESLRAVAQQTRADLETCQKRVMV